VALFDGERVLSETTWLAGREHSTRLLVEVEFTLDRVGAQSYELTGLVVARGPGSFTGVRVALSVAKGMASGLGIPAWGVSTLDAFALAAEPSSLPVRVLVEAGRGRYATGLYLDGVAVEVPRLATVQELTNSVTEPTVVVGEFHAGDREMLEANAFVRLAPKAACARRAGFVAELGWRLAQRGEPGNPSLLDALYLT